MILAMIFFAWSHSRAQAEACDAYLRYFAWRLQANQPKPPDLVEVSSKSLFQNEVVILVGPAGSLKGTLAQRLVAQHGFRTFSVGEALRSELDRKTDLGLQAEPYMRQGKNAPDEVVGPVISRFFGSLKGGENILLDGFPRNLGQVALLEASLKSSGRKVTRVLFFDVSLETSLARILGRLVCGSCKSVFHSTFVPPKGAGICDHCGGVLSQRLDDSEEQARARWETYQRDTAPLVTYYREAGLLVELNANQEADGVEAQILQAFRGQ